MYKKINFHYILKCQISENICQNRAFCFVFVENGIDLATPILELLGTVLLCAAIICHLIVIFTEVNIPRLPCTRPGVLCASAGKFVQDVYPLPRGLHNLQNQCYLSGN